MAIIASVRLFYCVELGDDVRAGIARSARSLQARIRAGTWVAPENLHVTLRFLGEVGEDLVPSLEELGAEASSQLTPFELRFDRFGAFPSPSRARVLWAGPTVDSAPFAALAHRIEEGVQALGFPPERRPAHPHVTLARLRVPQDLAPALAEAPPPDLQAWVDDLTLMASELRPEGPLYTPLARWSLGG